MKRGIILPIVVITWALSVSALPAQATLITIEITAEVDAVYDPSGYLEGNIGVGDTITGTYSYESTTLDTNPSPYVGDYEHFASPAGIFLSVGEFDFTTDLANVAFLVEIINDYTSGGLHDSYILRSYSNLPLSNEVSVDHISWSLRDSSATALSSTDLPTTAPVLDAWLSRNELRLEGERLGYIIDAHVTSAIPEPATIVLFAIGALLSRQSLHKSGNYNIIECR